jgi:hypothetical protein
MRRDLNGHRSARSRSRQACRYWTAAQLQPGREALALHLLAQENFTIYALKLRVRRTVCGRRAERR